MVEINELIKEAAKFAALAHAQVGQLRKHTFEPYIIHPTSVARTVMRVANATSEMVASAYLHDVIEDCGKTAAELEEKFGSVVAGYVVWLTDVTTPADGNRATRRAIEHERFKGAPPEVQTIKLADSNDNTVSIVKHDPKFAKVYMREKAHDMVLLKQGDSSLYNRAAHFLYKYFGQNGVEYDDSMLEFMNHNL